MHPNCHKLSPKPALRLWLCLLIVALLAAFPASTEAAKAGGGTTTTLCLTYVNGVKKWVVRIDPLNVQAFQLDIQFDPARCQLDQIIYKTPFNQTALPDLSQLGSGLIQDIAGSTLPGNTSPGDADIFELVFSDLQVGQPIDGVLFTVFASPNDSITAFDTDNTTTVTFDYTQIAPAIRVSTTDVDAHIWDPDKTYDNGTTGGPGTWDESLSNNAWDDLPIGSPNDTAWNNATHANDIAVFGGNPGTGLGAGIVTVAGAISVGGFQFDISGYKIQGGIITLSAPPGLTPTIDTGANEAIISSALAGSSGLQKVGTGTLTLAGSNTYTGATTIAEGTVKLDFSVAGAPSTNILNNASSLVLTGGTFNLTGASGGTNGQVLNGLTVDPGSSAITATQNGAANLGLALGAITRNVGGTVDFTLPTSGTISTASSNTNGILGGYATVGGNTWATVSGGNINGFNAYVNDTWGGNTNTNVFSSGSAQNNATTNSLRFDGAVSRFVDLSGVNTITSGGILVTASVGNHLSSIGNGTLTAGAGADLVIIQNNNSGFFVISSTIADNTTPTGLTKSGTGSLFLTGNNTYTGATTVNQGTLGVNGSTMSALSVKQGTFIGIGSVQAPVTIGDGLGTLDAQIAPGTLGSPALNIGTVNVGALNLLSDAVYQFDLNSTAQTADKIVVLNSVNLSLGLAQLAVTDLGSSTLPLNLTFTIIENLSANPTIGFFKGLPNGSTFIVGANTFQIAYNAGSNGNDVQITVVPEPSSWAMLFCGLGILLFFRRFCR